MTRRIKTQLFIYDERRLFTGDIARKFDDPERYDISSFNSRDEFLRSVSAHPERRSCAIAIIGAGEMPEQTGSMIESLREVRHIKGTILLCPPDKFIEIKKTVALSGDMCIPQNTNSVLRIHNLVKRIFSEYTINIYRRRRNRSVAMLGLFLLLSALLLLTTFVKFPQYF